MAGLAFAFLLPVHACIHVPRTYKGTVTEKTQEALLFHDGVNAHLIIKTNLQASSGSLPETMAWVVPLPSLPSHYEEADPGLFPEMFQVVEKTKEERESHFKTKGMGMAGIAPQSIRVHPMQAIGNYQVQPIEVLDPENAGGELNHWLLANGFGAVPPANQRFYLKKGVVFLALKIHGLRGGFSDIKPLHIVYKSDTLSLPLKFSTHSGAFDVELYAFTRHALNSRLLDSSDLSGDPSVEIKEAPNAPILWRMTGRKHGFLTRFERHGFNRSGVMVHDLKMDPTIDLRSDNSPRSDPSSVSQDNGFNSATDLRALAAVLVAALGFEFWRRKRGPRRIGV